MPVFHLQPLPDGIDDPAWAMSRYRGPCKVVAENAAQARLFANCAYIIPLQSAIGDISYPASPWSSDNLVQAFRANGVPEFGLFGSVEAEPMASLTMNSITAQIASRCRETGAPDFKHSAAA